LIFKIELKILKIIKKIKKKIYLTLLIIKNLNINIENKNKFIFISLRKIIKLKYPKFLKYK
jgi:hypothetical protein